jgi:hypothetical protein
MKFIFKINFKLKFSAKSGTKLSATLYINNDYCVQQEARGGDKHILSGIGMWLRKEGLEHSHIDT